MILNKKIKYIEENELIMLYALKNNRKIKATPKQFAECIGCKNPVQSYCGDIYTWHWKHKAKENCDIWHEPETNWHLDWKEKFDVDNTEVRISKKDKWHIADIYTRSKLVIELQYSNINKRVIEQRENFYGEKMIWLLHQKQLAIDPIPIDNFSYCYKQPFTIYFDTTEFGYPNWIIDFLDFDITENLNESLKNHGFNFDNNSLKYFKRSTNRTCSKWGFENDIDKKLRQDIFIYLKKIRNENPNLRKFSLWRKKESWSYSNRHIFVDYDNKNLMWLKEFKNSQYGTVEFVSKELFIKKYSND